jgi:hypothetical protein
MTRPDGRYGYISQADRAGSIPVIRSRELPLVRRAFSGTSRFTGGQRGLGGVTSTLGQHEQVRRADDLCHAPRVTLTAIAHDDWLGSSVLVAVLVMKPSPSGPKTLW